MITIFKMAFRDLGRNRRRTFFSALALALGLCLLLASAASAVSPPGMGLMWLAVGFGWLHLVFGAYIAWRHNG